MGGAQPPRSLAWLRPKIARAEGRREGEPSAGKERVAEAHGGTGKDPGGATLSAAARDRSQSESRGGWESSCLGSLH